MEGLQLYYETAHKRKLSHAPSTTISHKRPKLTENQSNRSKSSDKQSSRSKTTENQSNRSKSNDKQSNRSKTSEKQSSRSKPAENHSSPTSDKEKFKESLTEQYINKNILQQSWWKNLCDMSKNRKINRNADEADLEQFNVGGQRIGKCSKYIQ